MKDKEALVIDPHINEEVIPLFQVNSIEKVNILLTHEHYDHTHGVNWFLERYDCKLICNRICADIVAVQRRNTPRLVAFVLADRDRKDGGNRYNEFMKNYIPYKLIADIIYDTPCEFQLMGMTFKGSQTPGHSPGSWCLVVDDVFVITGDSLIKDTPVVIRFMESREDEYKAITLPYFKFLDENLMLLPGHFEPFYRKDIKL